MTDTTPTDAALALAGIIRQIDPRNDLTPERLAEAILTCPAPPPPPPGPTTLGIACSNCGGNDHWVRETRPRPGMIRRRLECKVCGWRHTTTEVLAQNPMATPPKGESCLTCMHWREERRTSPCSLGHPDPLEDGPAAAANCNDWRRDDDAAT